MTDTTRAGASPSVAEGAGGGAAVGPLELLVLQPSPFCNLDCDYCYLPQRTSTARMSIDTVTAAVTRARESGLVDGSLTIVWHAGEPLAVPRAWYEAAFAAVDAAVGGAFDVHHALQTNATLVTPEWCAWLLEHRVRVGVSVDGPAFLHDAHRKHRDGSGTHARTMKGLATLQQAGVPFHVISVVTQEALQHPEAMLRFYVDAGVERVGLNIEEIEGCHDGSSLETAESGQRVRTFFDRFLAAAEVEPRAPVVREADGLLGLIASPGARLMRNQENTPLRIVSVDHAGSFGTWSPELLGHVDERLGPLALGHVDRDGFVEALRRPAARALVEEVERGIEACAACAYAGLCGGGSPGNKLFETGRLDATETMHCRLSVQAVVDVVLGRLEARLGRR